MKKQKHLLVFFVEFGKLIVILFLIVDKNCTSLKVPEAQK